MGSYSLSIKASAGKELAAISAKVDRARIVAKIQGLADDPRPYGSEKLAGPGNRYRIRQGNFRIIYLIDDSDHLVTIFKIGNHKDVYR